MNNDILFCLSKLIMAYSFNLKALGLNVKEKDKEKPRHVTLIRKWWEEGARTRRCKKKELIESFNENMLHQF